jgi:hypothetical protein
VLSGLVELASEILLLWVYCAATRLLQRGEKREAPLSRLKISVRGQRNENENILLFFHRNETNRTSMPMSRLLRSNGSIFYGRCICMSLGSIRGAASVQDHFDRGEGLSYLLTYAGSEERELTKDPMVQSPRHAETLKLNFSSPRNCRPKQYLMGNCLRRKGLRKDGYRQVILPSGRRF